MGHIHCLHIGRFSATPFWRSPNIRPPGGGQPLRISRPVDLTKIVVSCSVAIEPFDALASIGSRRFHALASDIPSARRNWVSSGNGARRIARCSGGSPPFAAVGFDESGRLILPFLATAHVPRIGTKLAKYKYTSRDCLHLIVRHRAALAWGYLLRWQPPKRARTCGIWAH